MNSAAPRELDLVLFGATGFVGRLTARHLATFAPSTTRIGLAGRSLAKLETVRAGLGPAARSWPLVVADVTDPRAVADLAVRTRVVLSSVGPYLRYGLPLVTACASAGTDYADLTGETLFVRRSIDACHAAAVVTGARIVHSCGFDSVPSDLGVGLTAERAAAEGEGLLTEAVLYVRSLRAGVSGGTIDSLRQQLVEAASDPRLRALAADPRALTAHDTQTCGGPQTSGGSPAPKRARRPVERDPWTGHYQARFLMGGFNRQIVLRSREISGDPIRSELSYREVVDTGPGPLGAVKAAALAAGSTAGMAAMFFRPTRRVLDAVLPDPGQGPSERARRRGRFRVEVVAVTSTSAWYSTVVGTDRDPGYDATAVMLGESGLALAFDSDLPDRAGVLTPMTALGEALAVRLRTHDFVVRTTRLSGEPAPPPES